MEKRTLHIIMIISLTLIIILLTVFSIPKSYAARNTLYWGSRGSDVRLLQWKLSQWGYYNGRIDGFYGSNTSSAVKKFQRINGLRVDGVVGSDTWAALGYKGKIATKQVASRAVSRNDDVYLLARLVHAEARAEPFEGQVAVAAVLLNRIDSPSFPNSINGVIYQPLAFESVKNGQFNLPPNNENVKAARSALNGWDPTHGSLFFWNPAKPVSEWIWSRRIVRRIGNHVFAL